MKKITIVGIGTWGKKIREILSKTNSYIVEEISSRTILEQKTIISRPENIVWVTSPPEYQKQIMKLIDAKYMILEKPFITNKFEYKKWKQDLPSNVYLSLPWNYSEMWREIKPIFEFDQMWNIEIKRSGPIVRPYMTPIADWLPHDLGLIREITNGDNIKVIRKINLKDEKGTLTLLLGSNIKINWQGGYSEEKTGLWTISGSTQILQLDFVKSQSLHKTKNENVIVRRYFDNPILEMINQISGQKATSTLKTEFNIYKKIFDK